MTADLEAVERALDAREAAGLPRTVTDPAAYARVARLLAPAQEEAA